MFSLRRCIFALVFVSALSVNCSSDSLTGPSHRDPHSAFTLELTSVAGVKIPAVYYTDAAGLRSWADSATVTLQSDGVIAFRLYEGFTTPASPNAGRQDLLPYFASGELTSDSTFKIEYTNTSPDYGTINRDGSVTVDFNGVSTDGKRLSFGRWLFASAYHGNALGPAPHVDSITPSSVPVHSPDTLIVIDGASFTSASVVSIAGVTLTTSYVSAQQLRAVVPGWLLDNGGTLQVLVTNPGSDGGKYYFPFAVNRPIPTLTSLSPETITAGSVIAGITITGTGFDGSTAVTLNGVKRTPQPPSTPTSLYVPLDPADISGAGTIQVAVVNPPPGGGTSAPLPLSVTGSGFHVTAQVIAPMAAVLLVADPVRPVVYAALDGTDTAHPNSIVSVDGATGHILWAVAAGGTPGSLAISNDGQFLYFTAPKDSVLHRISLATASISLSIPFTNASPCAVSSRTLLVSPDNPHTIVVEHECTSLSGMYQGGELTVYDDSIARPHILSIDSDTPRIFTYGASSSVLYSFGFNAFFDISLDASGATSGQALANAWSAAQSEEVVYLRGKIYSTTGVVYDPVARDTVARLENYPATMFSIAPSRDGNALYVLTDYRQLLEAFDLVRGGPPSEVPVPGPMVLRRHLVRWGADGIAFISGSLVHGGDVYLVRTDLVH